MNYIGFCCYSCQITSIILNRHCKKMVPNIQRCWTPTKRTHWSLCVVIGNGKCAIWNAIIPNHIQVITISITALYVKAEGTTYTSRIFINTCICSINDNFRNLGNCILTIKYNELHFPSNFTDFHAISKLFD